MRASKLQFSSRWQAQVLVALIFAAPLARALVSTPSDSPRHLFPALAPGNSLQYDARGTFVRTVNTESKVASLRGPQELRGDLSNHVQLSIDSLISAKPYPGLAATAVLLPSDSAARNAANSAQTQKLAFTLLGNGDVGKIDGLEALKPEDRLLWQFWLARFAFGWTFPSRALRPGDKWKSEEPEHSDSLIADLYWQRETRYVRDDACPIVPSETCAVFLTESTLRQKSSEKDSTPEDYRLNHLKTSGTATGVNEVVSYISLRTGLIQRATEDATQSMTVTVLTADNTNGVHYDIHVSSHFETVLVPATAH